MISEPSIVAPEAVFEAVVIDVVRDLVRELGCRCVVVPRFGLDVALFLGKRETFVLAFLGGEGLRSGAARGCGIWNAHRPSPSSRAVIMFGE